MREIYSLTDETKMVLTDNVKSIALQMTVSDKYLYAVLSEDKTDPFAPFQRLYAAVANADRDTSPWDDKLAAIKAVRQKQQPDKPIVECLTDNLHRSAELVTAFLDALADGAIDPREAEAIQPVLDKVRSNLDLLETHLQFKRELKVAK